MFHILTAVFSLLFTVTAAGVALAATHHDVQARVNADIAAGKPLVVHVVVALCDNAHQGIVPVPKALGNGQNPKTNLYWGARYGLRAHLPRSANWSRVDLSHPTDKRILERVVLRAQIQRGRFDVPVFIVADAWNGANIRDALAVYLRMAAGKASESITINQPDIHTLQAGGASHLVTYVGHNGLMEFSLETPAPPKDGTAKSAMILACASRSYFVDHLHAAGAHPLLLTTGLMAPEAYTLDGAIRAWVAKGSTAASVEGAARAYHRFQRCGLTAARRLFWGEP